MKQTNNLPWQKIDSRIVYQNPWMTAIEDTMRMPNGREGIYGYIDSKPGVFVIALTEDQEIYLIESFRYQIQKWQWELPAGGIDKGLTPLDAAKQELKEELGITADTWTCINEFGPSSNGFMTDHQSVFVAEGLHLGTPTPSDFEAIRAVKTVSFDQLLEMIRTGELSDGQSLAALMQFTAWRQAR